MNPSPRSVDNLCAAQDAQVGGSLPSNGPANCAHRRDFTGLVALGLLAATACAGEDSVPYKPASKALMLLSELEPGIPVDFEYPQGHSAFVVKLGKKAERGIGPDKDVVAFHRACTHLGCAIPEVDAERAQLGPCPCHRSRFDLRKSGRLVVGLGSQNLVQVVLEAGSDGRITAVDCIGLPVGEALTEADV